MLEVYYTWIAMCLLFLLSTIWSEDNVHFGYVLVPLLAGFMWWAGILTFGYLTAVIPLIIVMGVLAHLRAVGKYKMGIFGSNSGLLIKIVVFLIFVQMSIAFVNGIGMFSSPALANQTNEYTTYTLTKAGNVYGGQTTSLNIADAITNSWNMIWTAWVVMWGMISAVLFIYPTLIEVFHIPESISIILQTGIYILYGITVFNMISRPYQPVEP